MHGKVGVFPSNFVEVIEELETPSKPPGRFADKGVEHIVLSKLIVC